MIVPVFVQRMMLKIRLSHLRGLRLPFVTIVTVTDYLLEAAT